MNITVAYDGTFECRTICGPEDWTGEIHNATFRVTIINPYNNTGSFSFWWRLAEYPDVLVGWLTYWFTHGNARPTITQILVSKLVVNWSADDDNITIKDYTISVEIAQDETFEICLFLYVPPFSKSWCSYQYTPMEI